MASPLAGKQRSWGRWSALGIGVFLILCAVFYLSNRGNTASMTFDEFESRLRALEKADNLKYYTECRSCYGQGKMLKRSKTERWLDKEKDDLELKKLQTDMPCPDCGGTGKELGYHNLSVTQFLQAIGKPFKIQHLDGHTYWYYECADGTIQLQVVIDSRQSIVWNPPNLF
jgi:hypothetical protein